MRESVSAPLGQHGVAGEGTRRGVSHLGLFDLRVRVFAVRVLALDEAQLEGGCHVARLERLTYLAILGLGVGQDLGRRARVGLVQGRGEDQVFVVLVNVYLAERDARDGRSRRRHDAAFRSKLRPVAEG